MKSSFTAADIRRWMSAKIDPLYNKDVVLEYFHRQTPRYQFLSTLPKNATVLDGGAGDGGLATYKKWPPPGRDDLSLYAFSLDYADSFEEYTAYEIGNWNDRPPFNEMAFDAIFAGQFLEHIPNPHAFIRWTFERLSPNGHLYIDYPSEFSLDAPKAGDIRKALEEAAGVEMPPNITCNFYDDRSHINVWDFQEILGVIKECGYILDGFGLITSPLFETDLLAHYQLTGDSVAFQYAYWLHTKWQQYIMCTKP